MTNITSIHHVRRGSGEPYVLIHGLGSNWRVWEPVMDELARTHDVIAIDLPGFGASAADGTGPTVPDQAQRVALLFDELGIGRPHVAGNSMGGGIALELARMGVVRTATAVSPVGFYGPRDLTYLVQTFKLTPPLFAALEPIAPKLLRSAAGRLALLSIAFARPGRLTPDQAMTVVDGVVRSRPRLAECRDAFPDYLFADGEELEDVPVTVAWGTRDLILPFRQSRLARQLLPGAQHVTLKGLGHVPFSDDPGVCSTVLLQAAQAQNSGVRPKTN